MTCIEFQKIKKKQNKKNTHTQKKNGQSSWNKSFFGPYTYFFCNALGIKLKSYIIIILYFLCRMFVRIYMIRQSVSNKTTCNRVGVKTEDKMIERENQLSRLTCINRMYHWSQPDGKRIMPETRFTSFPALSVDPRVGISRSALETDV